MARPGQRIPRVIVKQTIANAAGTATVRFDGPDSAFDVLHVGLIQIDCNSSLLPTARLYAGEAGIGQQIAVNPDGLAGFFEANGSTGFDRIDSGRVWTLQLTGATVGATLTATLTGTEQRR